MDLAILNDLVVPMACALCLFVGYIIKNIVETNRYNKYIPLIVGLVGVVAVCVTDGVSVVSITKGLASGLASTGLYEFYAQCLKEDPHA